MKPAILALACVLLSATAQAGIAEPAEPRQVYFQLDGGVSYFDDNEFIGQTVSYDLGWNAGLRVGAKNGRLTTELELGVTSVSGQAGFVTGDLTSANFGFNIAGDIVHTSWIDWYAGGGAGVAYNYLDASIDAFDDDAINANVHAETGLVLKPTDVLHLVPQYRFTYLPGIFDRPQFVHMARLGLRLVP